MLKRSSAASGGPTWFFVCMVLIARGMLAQAPFRQAESPLMRIVVGLILNAALYALVWFFILSIRQRRTGTAR